MEFNLKQTSLDQFLTVKRKSNLMPESQTSSTTTPRISRPRALNNCTKLSPFVRDTRNLSHPLYLATGNWKHLNYQFGQVKEAINKVCQTKFQFLGQGCYGQTALQSSCREQFASCVAIDEYCNWLAVGHMSGQIRLYETSVLRDMTREKHRSVDPFRVIDTKQVVRSLTWRCNGNKLELLVAFNFSGNIFIYEIGDVDANGRNAIASRSLYGSMPSRTLDSVGVSKETGYRCMVFIQLINSKSLDNTLASVPKSTVKKGIFSRANSSSSTKSSGYIPISTSSQSVNDELLIAGTISGYLRCWKLNANGGPKHMWCVKLDPHRPSSQNYEVLSVWMMSGTQLLAISQDGTFSCWDLTKFSSPAFGSSTREPLCYNSFNVESQLTIFTKGNEIKRKILRAEPYSKNLPHIAVVLIDDGTSCTVDILSRSVVRIRTEEFRKLVQWNNADVNAEFLHAPPQMIPKTIFNFDIFPGWMGILSYTELLCGYAIKINVANSDRSRCNPIFSSNGKYESSLCKTMNCSHTLLCRVEAAIPGNFEITLDCELSEYLVGYKMCDSIINKSSVVEFEYFDHGERRVWATQVANIRGQQLILREEYLGPLVENSCPSVRLKTNLRIGSSFKSNEFHSPSLNPTAEIELSAGGDEASLLIMNAFSLTPLQMFVVSGSNGLLCFFGLKSSDLADCTNSQEKGSQDIIYKVGKVLMLLLLFCFLLITLSINFRNHDFAEIFLIFRSLCMATERARMIKPLLYNREIELEYNLIEA